MAELPIISIKSEEVLRKLHVKTWQDARKKLKKFGIHIIDKEIVLIPEVEKVGWDRIKEQQFPESTKKDMVSSSSFNDMAE